MGRPLKSMAGLRFGMLTVIRRDGTYVSPAGHSAPTWLVKCDCGVEKTVIGRELRNSAYVSCGCKRLKGGPPKHGWFGTPEYSAWTSMKQRCTNPKCRNYPNYGGRGIRVCERWESSFEAFLADMGPRPSRKHSLDRENNNGNYEPGNCRWATVRQQARNKRTSRVLTVAGESATVAEWADRAGLGRSTVKERLRRNWTPENCLRPVAR